MNKLDGYKEEIKNKKILSVQINLLNRCTSHCQSCRKYMWPNDMLPIEDIFNTLKYLKDQGCTSVFFSGGDPICYPQFSDVIDYCMAIDLPYSLITTLICKNETLLEKIARTAYRIHVSMDADNIEDYKFIRGVDGFEIAKQAIDYINSIRFKDQIPIRLSSTIGALNYNKVFDIYKFAKDHECLINFYYIQLWGNLQMTNKMEHEFYYQLNLVASDEKCNKRVISNAKNLINEKYSFDNVVFCEKCYIPEISAIINCDGNIYPCCGLFIEFRKDYNECLQYSYGNIIGKSERELENEFNKRFSKQYPEYCKECDDCIKKNERYNSINNEIKFMLNETKKPLFI